MEKNYFKCFRLFLDTGKKITDVSMKAKYYESLLEYGLNGTKPDDPMVDALLTSAMYSIDRTDEERERKSESMRGNKNAEKTWENVSKQSKTDTNSKQQTITDKNIGRNKKNIEEYKKNIEDNNINKKENIKEKYLEFVMLTEDEHQKLINQLGERLTDEMIDKLNNYLGSTGKRYKSHYYTILTWARKEGGATTNLQKEQAVARHRQMIAQQIQSFNPINTDANTNIQTTNRREEMYG